MRLRFDYDSKVSVRESDLDGSCVELSIGGDRGSRFTVDMSLDEASKLNHDLHSVTEKVLNRPVSELLSVRKGARQIEARSPRALHVLRSKAKLQNIGVLVTRSEADMVKAGIGWQSLQEIKAAMRLVGVSFKKELELV